MRVLAKIFLGKKAFLSLVVLLFGCQHHDKSENEELPTYLKSMGLHFLLNNDAAIEVKKENIALFDEGSVRTSHAFFSAKKIDQKTIGYYSNHTTAVAGLIFSSFPKAQLCVLRKNNFSWWNSLDSCVGETFVSCHPYGRIGGWRKEGDDWFWQGTPSISEREDWKFGFYGKVPGSNILDSVSIAGKIDQFLYANPFHIAVFSAGNARDLFPPENASTFYWNELKNAWDSTMSVDAEPNGGEDGFDCLSLEAVSKNAFVVTAIENGQEAKKTSRGPTDDGRIKPDFAIPCGNISLVSAADDTSFVFQKEALTSYAAGVFSGACALLRTYFIHHLKEKPSAATLKSLLVQSAYSSQNRPDYRFGWGVPKFDEALVFIQEIAKNNPNYLFVSEDIESGDTFYAPLPPLVAGVGYRATLSWVDMQGADFDPALNNRKSVVVNDLDMEIFSEDESHLPWRLNPDFPEREAEQGINEVDNVERIDMQPSQNAPHFIRIVHKGNEKQSFTLVFSSVTTSCHPTKPE